MEESNNPKVASKIVPAADLEADVILYWPAVQAFSHLTLAFLTSLPSITSSCLLCFFLHMPSVNYVLLKLLYGNALGKLSSLPYLGVALGGGAGRRILWDWIHLCSFERSASQPVPLEGLQRMVKAEAGLEVCLKLCMVRRKASQSTCSSTECP